MLSQNLLFCCLFTFFSENVHILLLFSQKLDVHLLRITCLFMITALHYTFFCKIQSVRTVRLRVSKKKIKTLSLSGKMYKYCTFVVYILDVFCIHVIIILLR